MKSFITNACQNGKYILPFQVKGVSDDQIKNSFENARVLECGIPKSHTFTQAWIFRLVLDNGWSIDFSSACTGVGGWDEVGSLNLDFSREKRPADTFPWVKKQVTDFNIKYVKRLIYQNPDVYAESGIVFIDSFGREILVVAGQGPGSVSIAAPFSDAEFRPEFTTTKYERASL